ncbi:MAG: hypothetical protein V8Q32_04950 [Anaerotignum faecicola]
MSFPSSGEKQGKSGAALGKRGMAVCMAVVVAITGVSIAMLPPWRRCFSAGCHCEIWL